MSARASPTPLAQAVWIMKEIVISLWRKYANLDSPDGASGRAIPSTVYS